jgi:adhesin transport system membrane fusion protein
MTTKTTIPGDPDDNMELPRAGGALVLSSAVAIGGFLIWASWAEIDQITRADGQVISSSRNQIIQSADGGVMSVLYVREGAKVKRNQLLFRLDKTKTEASYLESEAKAAALKAAYARLNAEVFGGLPKFPRELSKYSEFCANQEVLFNRRQSAINEEITALQKSVELVKAELEMNLPLLKTGDVSKAEVLKLQRQVAELEGQITNRRNKYLQEAQADLAKAQEDLAGVMQILAQRKEQLDNTEARAPMDGVVRNVRITTHGGVAKPGEEIMQIVPMEDDLVIEAKVRPADIAFVKPGLPATVKLDAYDYTIYGSLNGEVTYISADTLTEETRNNEQAYYRVQVKTRLQNLKGRGTERIDIQPGMTAAVEIKTGSNTVLRYLTKPVTKTISESLGER